MPPTSAPLDPLRPPSSRPFSSLPDGCSYLFICILLSLLSSISSVVPLPPLFARYGLMLGLLIVHDGRLKTRRRPLSTLFQLAIQARGLATAPRINRKVLLLVSMISIKIFHDVT